MKKTIFTIICLISFMYSFAIEKEVIYVVARGEQIDAVKLHTIEDIFHEQLQDTFDVRLDQGYGIFSDELNKEIGYQEQGAVPIDEVKQLGLQKGADYLCVISVESSLNSENKTNYYFRAKIYDVETTNIEGSASYPNYKDKISVDNLNINTLQMVASMLLDRLGYKNNLNNNLQDDLKEAIEKDRAKKKPKKNTFKPSDKGGNMRFLSTFDSKGPIGLGFYFHKSYFQIGIDVLFNFGSELKDSDYLLDSSLDILKNDFILLNTEIKGVGTIHDEYIYPNAQLSISPGINLKYISLECGLGLFLCENVIVEYHPTQYSYNLIESTKKTKSYFMVSPSVSGYVPLGNQFDLSLSIRYNIIPNVQPLNGFVFSVGFAW